MKKAAECASVCLATHRAMAVVDELDAAVQLVLDLSTKARAADHVTSPVTSKSSWEYTMKPRCSATTSGRSRIHPELWVRCVRRTRCIHPKAAATAGNRRAGST